MIILRYDIDLSCCDLSVVYIYLIHKKSTTYTGCAEKSNQNLKRFNMLNI